MDANFFEIQGKSFQEAKEMLCKNVITLREIRESTWLTYNQIRVFIAGLMGGYEL